MEPGAPVVAVHWNHGFYTVRIVVTECSQEWVFSRHDCQVGILNDTEIQLD